MKKLILALGMVLLANVSFAATSLTGQVDEIEIGEAYVDDVIVHLTGTGGVNDCTSGNQIYYFDATSTLGKSLLSIFLTAKATGTDITVVGLKVSGTPVCWSTNTTIQKLGRIAY